MKWLDLWTRIARSAENALRSRITGESLPPGALTFSADLPGFPGNVGPPEGVEESRDLKDAEPLLADAVLRIMADFKAEQGRELIVTSVWRSRERQHALYEQGRAMIPQADGKMGWVIDRPGEVVTNIDGLKRRSRHNFYPSQAVDVCVDLDPGPGKHVVWDYAAYEPLGELCTRHGLVWGGSWTRFPDRPHLELPG